MTQIHAYIHFHGRCREAMTFYKDCLDAELTLQAVEGSPLEGQCPPAMRRQILHASLQSGALLLMGSDITAPGGIGQGNSMALSLNCSSEEEIRRFYERLSAGGTVIDPLKSQGWGALFGLFTDKFGVRWMLNYDRNTEL